MDELECRLLKVLIFTDQMTYLSDFQAEVSTCINSISADLFSALVQILSNQADESTRVILIMALIISNLLNQESFGDCIDAEQLALDLVSLMSISKQFTTEESLSPTWLALLFDTIFSILGGLASELPLLDKTLCCLIKGNS